MATGGSLTSHNDVWSVQFEDNLQEQNDEVMVLRSMFEDDEQERLRIISEAPEQLRNGEDQNASLFSIQLSVPVKHDHEQIHVDVCLPADNYNEANETIGAATFMRSDSGHRLMGNFAVKYLTPINLGVVLPPEYPSGGPPYFTLSSHWMTSRQLGALCQLLDKLWEESGNMPIIFTWIDWLENNACSYLGIEENIILLQDMPVDDEGDPRAIQDCENIDDTIITMLRYDRHEEMKAFLRDNQECSICYMEYPGTECFRISRCKHHFCRECMKSYCTVHVKDGTVLELLCPEHDCKNEIPPYIIKEALTEEDYERWERLTLLKGLDKMGDIIWCVRCKAPVVYDKNDISKLAYCVNCSFIFCTRCEQAAHQGSKCKTAEEEINEKQKKIDQVDEDEKLEIARKIQQLKDEHQSLSYLKEKTKVCPSCRTNVVKISGCNKVVCTNCHKSMCWSCGKDITVESYKHFTDFPSCGTYNLIMDGNDVNFPMYNRPVVNPRPVQPQRNGYIVDLELRIGLDPTVHQRVKLCPTCKQRNMQNEDGNNHMKCWNCKSNFCFMCLTRITGPVMIHYKAGSPCKQHKKL